jgi:hypothetical protein
LSNDRVSGREVVAVLVHSVHLTGPGLPLLIRPEGVPETWAFVDNQVRIP